MKSREEWDDSFSRAREEMASEAELYLQLTEIGIMNAAETVHAEIAAYLSTQP